MNSRQDPGAQLMDFRMDTFTRIVDRYGAITGSGRFAAPSYRSMAFAQLTYPESLRDIETCLSVHAETLSHGIRQPFRRSTLAMTWRKARYGHPCGVGPQIGSSPRRGRCTRRSWGYLTNTFSPWTRRPTVPVGLQRTSGGGGEDAHARPAGQHSEFYPHLDELPTFMPVDMLLPEAGAIRRGS